MPLLVLAVLRWLLSKAFLLIAIGATTVLLSAGYFYLAEQWVKESDRVDRLETIRVEVDSMQLKIAGLKNRLVEIGQELEEAQAKVERASQLIKTVREIKRSIEYVFLSAKEQYKRDRELRESIALKESQEVLVRKLNVERSELEGDVSILLEQLGSLEGMRDELVNVKSQFLHYVAEAWSRVRPCILGTVILIVTGPIVTKGIVYFIFAPLLSMAKPIRFTKDEADLPTVGVSSVSTAVRLSQGDRAWIKESYLQASDEWLKKRTRLVLDWKIPVTCFVAGLVELIEFRSGEGDSVGVITVSTQDRPEMEIGTLDLDEGASLIIRPRHIVGLVAKHANGIQIRRHWRFFHLQSWITLQFRYFELMGPCTVLISGIRGIRPEVLSGESDFGRRVNQEATIGFTPTLMYGAVKAETFWGYFRGFNPLFDDVFRGEGLFLCQEISSRGSAPAGRQFWTNVWNGVSKLLGI